MYDHVNSHIIEQISHLNTHVCNRLVHVNKLILAIIIYLQNIIIISTPCIADLFFHYNNKISHTTHTGKEIKVKKKKIQSIGHCKAVARHDCPCKLLI